MATSDYTDEDLYMHYRPYSADEATCLTAMAEHRARFPYRDIRTDGDWAGTTQAERDRAIVEAIKRASEMDAGPERQALISHALGGARVKAKAKASK